MADEEDESARQSSRRMTAAALEKTLLAKETPSLAGRVFRKYDVDSSGAINIEELREMSYDLGHALTDEDVEMAIKQLDANGDGQINEAEFVSWWRAGETRWRRLELDEQQRARMQQAAAFFQNFDLDRSGDISGKEFPLLLSELNRRLRVQKKVQEGDLDTSGDGRLSFNEFIDYLETRGWLYSEVDLQPSPDFRGALRRMPKVLLRRLFNKHGASEPGELTQAELRALVEEALRAQQVPDDALDAGVWALATAQPAATLPSYSAFVEWWAAFVE